MKTQAQDSELGKRSEYKKNYNPGTLFSIARAEKRREIGIDLDFLPFEGFDLWNHYEVSWLNSQGKPMVATAEIYYDCRSLYIIESKSLKLYFNALNNTQFDSLKAVEKTIVEDLGKAIRTKVFVRLALLAEGGGLEASFEGECIDGLEVSCSIYQVDPQLLVVENTTVNETLCSNLLKSNCLVTSQPDWGSLQITYSGSKINREGLLQYIVSYRNHNEFHEQCIERIFMDIMLHCKPQILTVYGRYTRRGGLDINPYRSTLSVDSILAKNVRLVRQ